MSMVKDSNETNANMVTANTEDKDVDTTENRPTAKKKGKRVQAARLITSGHSTLVPKKGTSLSASAKAKFIQPDESGHVPYFRVKLFDEDGNSYVVEGQVGLSKSGGNLVMHWAMHNLPFEIFRDLPKEQRKSVTSSGDDMLNDLLGM